MRLILTLIIIVAAFNIISGLIMLVKNKGRDIAILRTMGATSGAILRIFSSAGASIGVVGTLAGFVLGPALLPSTSSRSGSSLQSLTGTDAVQRRRLFPVAAPGKVDPREVVTVVVMALGAVVPGDALPGLARLAARSGGGAAL